MSFAQGAPTQPLVLQGSNVFLYGSSTAGNAFTVQQQSAGNVASFVTSTGATSLFINPSGNVGIGTTNPQYILHVTGAAASTVSNIVVEAGTNAIGQRSEIRFGIPSFSGTGKRAGITSNTYVSDGSDLQFWTNASGGTLSTPQMTILQSGFVGIGTTNPTKLLQVWGGLIIGASSDSRATTVTLNAPGATATFSPNSDIGDGARIMCLQCPDLSSTTANLVSFSLQVAPTGTFGSQRTSLDLKGFRVASQSYGGFCITSPFDTAGSYDLFYADRTKAYFQQNVGIGLTSPSMPLTIYGASGNRFGIGNADVYLVQGQDSSTNRSFLQCYAGGSSTGIGTTPYSLCLQPYGGNTCIGGLGDNGNKLQVTGTSNFTGSVGIGTASPSYLLDVNGQSRIGNPALITDASTVLRLTTSSGASYIQSGTALSAYSVGDIVFTGIYGNPEFMRIKSTGNVGIGTTNPASYTLQVAGTIGASGDITALYSDERLKTKTGALTGALDKVCSLDTFTYRNNELAQSFGFKDDYQRVGVSAQQVRKVLPEAVRPAPFDAENQSGQNYLTVQYEKLVPLLIEALKEERRLRCQLEERVAALESASDQVGKAITNLV